MVITPAGYAGGSYACIMVHGVEATGGAWDWMTASRYRWPIVRNMVDRCGLYSISADLGGSATWGNSTLLARLDEAFAYTQTFPQVKKGKVLLVGQSMGGLAMLNWAKANPSKVAGMVGVIPVTNMNSAIADAFRSQINAAYGGSYSDAAHGANHNPQIFASALAGIPGQLWVGRTDVIARLDDANVVASGAPSIHVMELNGAHDESTLGLIDLAEMERFLNAHKA